MTQLESLMKRKLMVLVTRLDHSWLPRPRRTDGNANGPGCLCKTGSPPAFTKARELSAVLERETVASPLRSSIHRALCLPSCGNGLPCPGIQ